MKKRLKLMFLSSLSFVCCAVGTFAQTKEESDKNQIVDKNKAQIEAQASQLIADRVELKKTIELQKINLLEEQNLEARENLLYPADELYGSVWNNEWVDPFVKNRDKVVYPDSFLVNCASFVFPIDSMIRVTSKYGPRRRRMHRGIDLKVYVGDTIRAAFDGKVRVRSFERRGYGYYLVLRHPNGLETIYGHLSRFLVKENEIVRAGEPIGLGGNTGRSTGSHLHFETRFLGQAINPSDIIDFENQTPIKEQYVFRSVKIQGKNSNIYTSSNQQLVYHRVKSGDNLSAIAKKYGTTVSQICRLNGITTKRVLRPGQSLRISGTNVASVSSAKTVNKREKVVATSNAVASAQKATAAPVSVSEGEPVYYRIKSGDTLGAIAAKYHTTVSKLCKLNGITDRTVLRIGRSLRCL